MKESNRKYEYVIGIDFGHGETSAAVCPLSWDTPVEQLEPVKDLEMGGNKKVIPSAITILDDGTAYIGDSAFNTEILKKAKVHVCFKQAPKDINGEPEKIMTRFMAEVYKRIRANNPGYLTDGNHLVYIATPSGWDQATQQLYVKMAQEAGIPILDDGVTKESRAAFVKSQHDVTSGMGRNIEKGAIVFDMGSSTLDFTYMNNSLDHLIDNGYDCGASKVEKLIFAQKEKESAPIQLFEKKYPQLTDYLLFEARKFKEQVYFDPTLKVKKTINFEDFIDDEELEDENFKLASMPGELNAMLEREGYIETIAQAMIDYKINYIPDQEIYGVFLTGGASRMDFIKGMVCKYWNVSEDRVYRDTDPSLTISQGVAEVARMDLRTEGMDEGLGEAINKLMESDEVYNTFLDKFGGEIWADIVNAVAAEINHFEEDATKNYSINYLQNQISTVVRNTIQEDSPKASKFMQISIETCLKDIQAKVEDIVKHYAQQGMNTKVNYKVTVPTIEDINLNGVMDVVTAKIVADSSQWSDAITSVAFGSIIAALIWGGPLGWIIGGALLLGQLFFGDTEEEKKAKAMAKELTLEERKKVCEEFEKKWEDIKNQMAQSIYASLTSDDQIKTAIQKCVKQTMQSYRDNLKAARILID